MSEDWAVFSSLTLNIFFGGLCTTVQGHKLFRPHLTNNGANKLYLNTNALPATYDATGSWTNSTNNNWVASGPCFVQANETINSNFTQNGNKVTIVVDGINYNGYVREATYTATSTYLVLDGTVTTNLSFTLSSSIIGSGSVNWYWTDGQDSCFGGSDLSIARQGNVNGGGGGGGVGGGGLFYFNVSQIITAKEE